jgi:predicted ATP-grasp superfamily ATP-dependent carboligase
VSQPGALVLGASYRALGIVRSLGRRGIPVWVVDEGDLLACTSRYARRRLRWPSSDEDACTAFLLRTAEQHGLDGWVVFPTTEENAALVARQHASLSGRLRPSGSPWPKHRVAADKRAALELARSLGMAVPRTFVPRDAAHLDACEISFPAILKPAQRVDSNPFTDDKAWRTDSWPELRARYGEAARLVAPGEIMIQELIPGGGDHQFSFAAVCVNGDVVGSVAARRTRQYPTDFGRASTFVETIDDDEIGRIARPLLSALALDGMVEVEFKRDPRTGEYKLLDVNPRAWGWHSVGESCGVDFAYLAYLVASGRDVRVREGRPGARWVRLSTDLPTSIRELVHGRLALGPYLRTLRPPLEGPLAAFDDPLPALLELPLIARLVAKRLRGGGSALPRSAAPPMSARTERVAEATVGALGS